MNRDQKAAVVEELADALGAAQAVIAVDYRGLSVPQAAALRARLRDADATFRIVKNSLTERAADRAERPSLKELLDGPTALTFVHGDAATAAKALSDAQRGTGILAFKGGVMDGAPLSAEEVTAIARLPARDVLYAQLVGTVAAPLTGLVRGLNALIGGLAVQLQAIHDQGLVGGGEEPAGATASAPDEGAPAEESGGGDAQEAAEQPSDDPDAEPLVEAPEPQPDQAEGDPHDAPASET